MSRTKKDRLIQMAPDFNGFDPQGVKCRHQEDVMISFEEYEALNLCDYELMKQSEAATLMNISRPTFTRIYESVRRKIAKAFIEGRSIRFDIGNSAITEWHKCSNCKISFTITDPSAIRCPLCKTVADTANTL
jgi:uncharacterized protein